MSDPLILTPNAAPTSEGEIRVRSRVLISTAPTLEERLAGDLRNIATFLADHPEQHLVSFQDEGEVLLPNGRMVYSAILGFHRDVSRRKPGMPVEDLELEARHRFGVGGGQHRVLFPGDQPPAAPTRQGAG